jgi:hypothetical protein
MASEAIAGGSAIIGVDPVGITEQHSLMVERCCGVGGFNLETASNAGCDAQLHYSYFGVRHGIF